MLTDYRFQITDDRYTHPPAGLTLPPVLIKIANREGGGICYLTSDICYILIISKIVTFKVEKYISDL